jgi:hypothetical protein
MALGIWRSHDPLSRARLIPVFDGWKEMIWSGELKLRIGSLRKIHAVSAFLTPAGHAGRAASEKLHPTRLSAD